MIDYRALAEQFGTPLYVYDGVQLTERIREVRAGLDARVEVFYSLKANPNISIFSVLRRGGANAEVSSAVELETALRAGAEPDRIIFLGPGKSVDEIERCIQLGIRAIVCESLQELDLISDIAMRLGRTPKVVLRVNADFTVKGSGLTMGGKPRQFGIDEAQLLAEPGIVHRAGIELTGVHAYMGTRILSVEAIVENTERILERAQEIARVQRFALRFVDVGGGWGVPYFDNESELDPDLLYAAMNAVLTPFLDMVPEATVAVELGRYLAAPVGTYMTKVRYTKESQGEQFAITDGGTNHHMAAVGVGSFVKRNFPTALLGDDARLRNDLSPWNVTGPLCTPGDTIAKKAMLPDLHPGDLIGIGSSGAYGPSASPGLFLSHGFPAEVLVLEDGAHLVREADTLDDLLAKQRLVLPRTAHDQELGSPRADHHHSPEDDRS